jgi:type I restriction enzyme S subunit
MGQSPDSAAVNGTEAGLPFLQGCAEFGERFPSPRLHCSPPLRVAKAGSTLISVRAPVGTTNRADQDYCIGRGLGAVLAKAGVADDVFLLHAIEANLEFLHRRSQGSTFLAISSKDLYSLPVPAPSLPTQRRIAEILSTLDEAIEQTEALIAKMQQVKAGLMHDLFTRGVTPDGRLRPTREQAPELYKESPLGWIPREWEIEKLGDLCDVTKLAGFEFTNVIRYRDDGEIIALRALNIKNEELNLTDIQRISRHVSDSLPRSKVRAGDVLITYIGAYIGDVLLVSESDKYHLAPNVARITLQRKVNGRYLESTLRSSFIRSQMSSLTAVTATPSLTMTQIRKLLIPYPTGKAEQHKIEMALSEAANSIKSERMQLELLQMQKHGLMHDLLTGYTPV